MKPSSLVTQIALLKNELALRERVYPVKIKMRQMSQEQADSLQATLRAAIKSLSERQPATDETERFLKIEPILHHIHACASKTKAKCESCLAVAQLLEDSLGFVRPRK